VVGEREYRQGKGLGMDTRRTQEASTGKEVLEDMDTNRERGLSGARGKERIRHEGAEKGHGIRRGRGRRTRRGRAVERERAGYRAGRTTWQVPTADGAGVERDTPRVPSPAGCC